MFKRLPLLQAALFSLCLLLFTKAYGETPQNTLKPFSTDGCSMWINGTFARPNVWRHCCVAHDKAYWIGGTQEQRKIADEDLKSCIKQESTSGMAEYMYFMVRWAGHPDWINWYRWGYGWNYLEKGEPRGYKISTAEEQQQIDALMPQAEKTIEDDVKLHPVKK